MFVPGGTVLRAGSPSGIGSADKNRPTSRLLTDIMSQHNTFTVGAMGHCCSGAPSMLNQRSESENRFGPLHFGLKTRKPGFGLYTLVSKLFGSAFFSTLEGRRATMTACRGEGVMLRNNVRQQSAEVGMLVDFCLWIRCRRGTPPGVQFLLARFGDPISHHLGLSWDS